MNTINKELDLTSVDISKIIDFGHLFESKNFLVSLDISNRNVSNVTKHKLLQLR